MRASIFGRLPSPSISAFGWLPFSSKVRKSFVDGPWKIEIKVFERKTSILIFTDKFLLKIQHNKQAI